MHIMRNEKEKNKIIKKVEFFWSIKKGVNYILKDASTLKVKNIKFISCIFNNLNYYLFLI